MLEKEDNENNLLQVCSDVHLDYEDITPTEFSNIVKPNAKILVLAGDIGNPFTEIYEQFIHYCSERFLYVLCVIGNHEYSKHKNTIAQTNYRIRAVLNKFSNVRLLNNQVFEYDGITFVGTTLWSYISNGFNEVKSYYKNDLRSINGFSHIVSNYLFKANLSFIKMALNKYENCIIITHHAPSMKCISEKYNGDILNCCFATDLEYLFNDPHILGWIYGHTHHNINSVIKRAFLYGNCYRGANYVNGAFI